MYANLFLQIIGIIFPIALLVGVIYLFISSLITIIKKRKQLNNIFKISKEHKIRDVIQIVFHSLVYICILAFCFTICYETNKPHYPTNRSIESNSVRKAVSTLNQAIMLEFALEGTEISKIETQDDFIALFERRIDTTEKKKLPEKYQKKEYFQTGDGIIYSITKFEKGCKVVDIENPMNSSCVIEFDINSDKEPNKLNVDIFQTIVDGDNMKILPSADTSALMN